MTPPRQPLLYVVRDTIRAVMADRDPGRDEESWAEVDRPPQPPAGQAAPLLPYTIVTAGSSVLSGPPLADPWADGTFDVTATSVGGPTPAFAEAMADAVREILLGIDANGHYVNELELPAGHAVRDREGRGPGPLDPAGDVFQVIELFTLAVVPV